MTSTMTDNTLATLYRDACAQDAQVLAEIDPRDLVDLAQGRLAGERRRQVVEAIAISPSLAAAYRLAKASGEWAQSLSSELAGEARAPAATVHALPARPVRVAAIRRHPFALAAAVSAMAIGAVFVGQRLQAPADPFAEGMADIVRVQADSIASASFDNGRGGEDRIFSFGSSRESAGGHDGIFGQDFGGGS
jgi:uncharacterized membrane protein YgcG